MTEVLNGILRAVRLPTAAKMATGIELGKLLSQNELQRSACQPRTIRPNVLDRIDGTAICGNVFEFLGRKALRLGVAAWQIVAACDGGEKYKRQGCGQQSMAQSHFIFSKGSCLIRKFGNEMLGASYDRD